MPIPVHFSVRLLIYWISGIFLSNYYSPLIFIVLIACLILPLILIIGGIGLVLPIGQLTNDLLISIFGTVIQITPMQIKLCVDLSQVIGLYIIMGLLVYIAHKALHQWREKEY